MISVLTANFNTKQLTDCMLSSLMKNISQPVTVFIADNSNKSKYVVKTQDVKIIIYIVFLSFNLSEIVEYPIRPNALQHAVILGNILKATVDANTVESNCFS